MRQSNITGTGTHLITGGSFSSLSNEKMSPVPSLFRNICLLLLACIWLTVVTAQKTYTVGDRLPPVRLTNLINYSIGSTQSTTFTNNNLLIIKFWATWCSSCLKGINTLDSLRRQYSFNVLLVNPAVSGDDEKKIRVFLEKRKAKGIPVQYPVLVKDTVLTGFFPHNAVPHYVWINGKGEVLAITGSEDITAANVSKAIEGKPLNLAVKKDVLVAPSHLASYLDSVSGRGSLFTTYIKDIPEGYINVKRTAAVKTLTWFNQSADKLILAATTLHPNRWFINISDTASFYNRSHNKDLLYSYEITKPLGESIEMQANRMFNDLAQNLPYQVSIEEKEQRVLLLERIDTSVRFPGSVGKSSFKLTATSLNMSNMPLSRLVTALNNALPYPVIDSTGISQNITLSINASLSDINALTVELKKHNLTLIKTTKKIPALVIRDKPNNSVNKPINESIN